MEMLLLAVLPVWLRRPQERKEEETVSSALIQASFCSFLKKRTKKLLVFGVSDPAICTPKTKCPLLLFFRKGDLP
jgi:hypothetical protein